MRIAAEPCAVDVSSSQRFEEEISDASSENGLFIAKMEFSVQTTSAPNGAGIRKTFFEMAYILSDLLLALLVTVIIGSLLFTDQLRMRARHQNTRQGLGLSRVTVEMR
jgi:hypothetical protein